jgi:hypothetical protein
MFVEAGLVLAMWAAIAIVLPRFFLTVYLPGWAIGLGLCFLQGHFEHERGTTSHYGRVYNALFFNDGYHVEHHARPGALWTEPACACDGPTPLRAAGRRCCVGSIGFTLESLETIGPAIPHAAALRSSPPTNALCGVCLSSLPPNHACCDRRRRTVSANGDHSPPPCFLTRRWSSLKRMRIMWRSAKTFLGDSVEYRHERWDARQSETVDLVIVATRVSGRPAPSVRGGPQRRR